MDPNDPNVLFVGMWDFRRKGWTFRSGGDGPDKPSGERPLPLRGWRRDLDGSHPGSQQGISEETVRPARGGDRSLELEADLLLRRIDRQRALRFR